jgi:uncharacterized RDD family membrane protein YckC
MDFDAYGLSAASVFRRVSGWIIDYLVVMIPGTVLVLLVMAYLLRGLPGFLGEVAAEAGWGYLVGLVVHTGTGASSVTSGAWTSFAFPLIVALLLVPLMQFFYQATLLAWRGRTFGKMIADTRVVVPGVDTARLARGPALRRAFLTTTLDSGLVGVAFVLITIGQIFLGGLLWAVAIAAFWLSALAAISPRRRTLVDRFSGTTVIRRGLYAELATRTTAAAITAGRHTSEVASLAARRASEAAVAAGRAVTDAAAGQLARTGSEAAPRGASVRQAPSAQPAQQDPAAIRQELPPARQELPPARRELPALPQAGAPDAGGASALEKARQLLEGPKADKARQLGAAGAEHARKLGDQATVRARQISGRAQEIWRQRKAGRAQSPPDPEQPASDQ